MRKRGWVRGNPIALNDRPAHTGHVTTATWTNWGRCAAASPAAVEHPASVDELARTVRDAAARGLAVKPVGAGHSFTPIAATDGALIELDRLTGIESVEPTGTGADVTVYAGTSLRRLNSLLWSLDLSMINLGDIDVQTVAGAIATGTHGTGAGFGGLATQVRAVQVITARGEALDCSAAENPQLFQAARLGLGAIGVIGKMTIACHRAFVLHAEERPEKLDDVLADLPRLRRDVDHFEFYWWPHTRRVLTKRNTRLPRSTPLRPVGRVRSYLDDELLSNTAFEGINRISTRMPALIPRSNALAARLLSPRAFTDASPAVFTSTRRVRFREMEYAIPAEEVPGMLTRIDRLLAETGMRIGFPVEVRFAAADDVWMSTAHGRATAYVAVHVYWRQDYDRYFRAVEEIARSVDGRPHWGKLHFRTAADLRPAYPHFDDFLAVRDAYDPDRVFGNEYLTRVLG